MHRGGGGGVIRKGRVDGRSDSTLHEFVAIQTCELEAVSQKESPECSRNAGATDKRLRKMTRSSSCMTKDISFEVLYQYIQLASCDDPFG